MDIDPKVITTRVIPNSLKQNAEVMLRATDSALNAELRQMVSDKLALEKFQLQCLALARLCEKANHPKADETIAHLCATAAFAPSLIECVKVTDDILKGN